MQKRTKYCEVEISMVNGLRLTGRFHIDMSSSSTVRPSDAFRFLDTEFFILTNVTVETPDAKHARDTVMVRASSIAHIEFMDSTWKTDEVRKAVPALV
ncbi:MAG: hypothetical protein JNG88_14415 [Phycisphaerales bacterium]|nr:hypothetical protein [Phycisphaerales bacterium]